MRLRFSELPMTTRRLAIMLSLAALLASAAAGFVRWRVSRVESRAASESSRSGEYTFGFGVLEQVPPPGVEWLSTPAGFTDAAVFQGHLYLLGPNSLLELDSAGNPQRRFHTGMELPAVPLTALAVGFLPGDQGRELLIATGGEGLFAFDGHNFRQLRPDAAAARTLTTVLPLKTGRVLVGTEKAGVLAFDGRRLAPFHPSLAGFHVTALGGDDSDLWVGTLDRGVLHWHAGQLEAFSEEKGLPDPQVTALAVAGARTFVGTALGVVEFVEGRWSRKLADGLFARSLLVSGGRLLVGTLDEGTLTISLGGHNPLSARPRIQPKPAQVEKLFTVDSRLFALAPDGLYASTAGGWQRTIAGDEAQLADRNVSALTLDAGGHLWVGYFDRGMDVLEPSLRRSAHYEDNTIFCVNRIVPAQQGMAVATANGLALFDASGRLARILTRGEGLIADNITDVAVTSNGMIVATPAGITQIDAAGARSLYAFHGLVNNHAYALGTRAGSSQVLIGTLGGLSILEGGLVRASFTTANSGLKHNWITALAPVGHEWFAGTYGGGLQRFDSSGRWSTFLDVTGDFEVNPNAMLVTPNYVLAGTLGRGLYVYDRKRERWSPVTRGLPSLNVTALATSAGMIYVGTDNGLVRFSEQQMPF